MKVIKAHYQIMTPDMDDPKTAADIYREIEESGRTCYVSEAAMTDESGEKFVRTLVKNGHEAMIEHASMKVKFIVDRGVSHEIVRHRLCSFAQESTRYCNYSKGKFGSEITVIEPCFFMGIPKERRAQIREETDSVVTSNRLPLTLEGKELQYYHWYNSCREAEVAYLSMLDAGATPQEARSVLPNSLKTTLIVKADMREWRNIFKLRAAGEHGKPHPQMLEIMVPLLNECKLKLPALFDDITALEE